MISDLTINKHEHGTGNWETFNINKNTTTTIFLYSEKSQVYRLIICQFEK